MHFPLTLFTCAHVLFSFTAATVIEPRPVPHVIEDVAVVPRGLERKGASAISNSTATPTRSSSLITDPPTTGWPSYSRKFPAPGCTPTTADESARGPQGSAWCRVHPGTVEVYFWPTSAAARNRTYPSTYYLSEYDVTMTRPSVYYVIDKIIATDLCGQEIGPPQYNFVASYDLWNVSTLQPYASAAAKTRMGGPQQLELDDLRDDCPKVDASDVPKKGKNTNKDGCNPTLEFNIELKNKVANGAWRSCGRYVGGTFGLFDPPVPIAPCFGDDCGYGPGYTTQPTTSTTLPTAETPFAAVTSHPQTLMPSETTSSITTIPTTETSIPTSQPDLTDSPSPGNPQGEKQTTSTTYFTPVATLPNSEVIYLPPGGSNIVIGSQTVTLGAPAITIPGGGVVSLAPIGIVVSNSDSGVINTIAMPAAYPTQVINVGIVAGQTISAAAAGSSAVIVGGQKLSLGGPVVTLSGNQVASLGSSGIVIQAPSGIVTTLNVHPTPGPSTSSTGNSSSIGEIIMAFQGKAKRVDIGILAPLGCLICAAILGL